jgi:hypothetical protein
MPHAFGKVQYSSNIFHAQPLTAHAFFSFVFWHGKRTSAGPGKTFAIVVFSLRFFFILWAVPTKSWRSTGKEFAKNAKRPL